MKNPTESAAVLFVIESIHDLLRRLPGRSISPAERSLYGGRIPYLPTALSRHVLWALEGSPDLYPDLADRAKVLREHQARADYWQALSTLGQSLTTYARQNYLREQYEAVSEAKQVLDQVRLTGRNPGLFPGQDHALRTMFLYAAYLALARDRERAVVARRDQAAKKTQDPPIGEGREKAQAQNKANKADAKAQNKAAANASLLGLFREVLGASKQPDRR